MPLLPKTYDFYACFEASTSNICHAAEVLQQLFVNGNATEKYVQKLEHLEHEGDRITHDTLEHLNKSFITPLDREDIHSLITRLDDILDLFYAAARRYITYKIVSLPESVPEMARFLQDTTRELQKAILRLRELKHPEIVLAQCIEINRIENLADDALRKGLGQLFDECTNPIELIKVKEVLENLEAATDACEDVANVIEGIVLKHA